MGIEFDERVLNTILGLDRRRTDMNEIAKHPAALRAVKIVDEVDCCTLVHKGTH
jgi:hypothetical protein